MITDEGRNCTKCGDFKPWSEFALCGKVKSGHKSSCKICVREEYKIQILYTPRMNT